MVVMRIHRDTYPKTDHGYTWVECIWFERDGKKVSPIIPSAGCCERLASMPGGPVRCDIVAEEKHYAPVYRKRQEDDAGNEEDGPALRGFKVVHVFDISQTDGEKLPELAQIEGEPGELLQSLEGLVRSSGIALNYEDMPYGTKGVSRRGEIAIAEGLPPAEQFSVLAHELAHEWMHDAEQRKRLDSTVCETEAEAVAYVVCRSFGLDCSTRSSDYIQMYRGSAATLMESLDRIQKTAARMIESLSKSQSTESEEGRQHVA